MFELTRPTTATLVSVTNRPEHHGEDIEPAVSLGLLIETSSSILETLCPQVRQLLGVPGIDTVTLKTVCQGWVVTVEHGIDEDDPIKLGGCKVDKFKVKPKDDNAVELRLRVGSSDIAALPLGLLGMKVGQEVVVKLTAPKGATQTETDAELKALDKQRALEAAGQGRIDEEDTPEKALARGTPRKARSGRLGALTD
jgi:hypothetical protein